MFERTHSNLKCFAGRPALYLCVLALLSVLLSAVQAAKLPTLGEYRPPESDFTFSQPLPLTDRENRPQSLVGLQDGMLRLAFPNMPGAEAIVPLDDPGLFFTATPPEDIDQIRRDSLRGNYDSVLRSMDLVGPRILRLVNLPPLQSNFASLGELYYSALVTAGDVERAVELTLRMPVEGLPQIFAEHARWLTLRAIREGKAAEAEQLLVRLQATMSEAEFAEFAFTAADLLRTGGQQNLAAKIYGTIAESDDSELRQRSLLWAVYTYAVLGDAEAARELLSELAEPGWDNANFTQYCLARGRLAMLEGEHAEALHYISRAMVLTTLEASFKPELYYLLSKAYSLTGDAAAAARLAREFAIFYPENPWLAKYQSETN